MNLLILIIAISYVHSTHGLSNGVPVLIMEENPPDLDHSLNPLTTIQSSTFSEIIAETILKNKVIIIFVEESLSVEDFSLKDKEGSPYRYLQGLIRSQKATYYPSVEEPYVTLKSKMQAEVENTFVITDASMKIQIFPNNLPYFYVRFKESKNEKRAAYLRRHDKVISDVYEATRRMTNGPVSCFYTSATAPEKRLVLVPLTSSDPGVFVSDAAGIFYLKDVVHVQRGTRATLKETPVVTSTDHTDKGVVVNLKYATVAVDLIFTFWDSGWGLDEAVLHVEDKEAGRSRVGAVASWDSSYACAHPIFVSGADESIEIGEYQIQPFAKADGAAEVPVEVPAVEVPQVDVPPAEVPQDDVPTTEVPLTEVPPAEVPAAETKKAGEDVTSGEERRRRRIIRELEETTQKNARYKRHDKTKFANAELCTVLFTTPILMGTMVGSMLTSALVIGVTAMMNLKVNDRFDDPHGKALVINIDHHH